VAETRGEHAPTPMKRVGINDTYSESAPNDDLLEKYGLTPAHIAQAARGLLQSRRRPGDEPRNDGTKGL
jgi:transketolase